MNTKYRFHKNNRAHRLQIGASGVKAVKTLFFIWFLCGTLINAYPQNNIEETRSYVNDYFKEIIVLYPEGTFWYCQGCSPRGGAMGLRGYWHVDDNNLILNSINQKRITVLEGYNDEKPKYLTVYVSSNVLRFTYNLHVVNNNNDTLSFYEQTHETITKKRIKKGIKNFWIEDVKTGLKSNIYEVQSVNNNTFIVFFDRSRIFENESWPFINDILTPRNSKGELQNYYLKKGGEPLFPCILPWREF